MSAISWKKPPNISFRVLGFFGFFSQTNDDKLQYEFRVVVRVHFYQYRVFKWWGFSST